MLKDGPCKEVIVKLFCQEVPLLIHSGHAEDENRLPELASATWIEKPASAEALLTALANLRHTSDVTV